MKSDNKARRSAKNAHEIGRLYGEDPPGTTRPFTPPAKRRRAKWEKGEKLEATASRSDAFQGFRVTKPGLELESRKLELDESTESWAPSVEELSSEVQHRPGKGETRQTIQDNLHKTDIEDSYASRSPPPSSYSRLERSADTKDISSALHRNLSNFGKDLSSGHNEADECDVLDGVASTLVLSEDEVDGTTHSQDNINETCPSPAPQTRLSYDPDAGLICLDDDDSAFQNSASSAKEAISFSSPPHQVGIHAAGQDRDAKPPTEQESIEDPLVVGCLMDIADENLLREETIPPSFQSLDPHVQTSMLPASRPEHDSSKSLQVFEDHDFDTGDIDAELARLMDEPSTSPLHHQTYQPKEKENVPQASPDLDPEDVDAIFNSLPDYPTVPSSETNVSILDLAKTSENFAAPSSYIRPAQPHRSPSNPATFPPIALPTPTAPIPHYSPILGLSPTPRVLTVFRIGEALRHGARAYRLRQNPDTPFNHSGINAHTVKPAMNPTSLDTPRLILELYARVTSSHRDHRAGEQWFALADLWHPTRPPFLKAVWRGWKGCALEEGEGAVFLGEGGEGRIGRFLGTVRREKSKEKGEGDGLGWVLEVRSVWDCGWEDVRYVEKIVCAVVSNMGECRGKRPRAE